MITSRMWDHLLKDSLFMLSIIRNILSFLIFFWNKNESVVALPPLFCIPFFYFYQLKKRKRKKERMREWEGDKTWEREGGKVTYIVSGDLFIVVYDDNWVFYHFFLKLQRFKVNKQHKIIEKCKYHSTLYWDDFCSSISFLKGPI